MPKYRYAFDSTSKVIDVLELPKNRIGLDRNYTCISCGLHLVAKTKNDERVKHFAHATDSKNKCSAETYLHKLGKAVFRETFLACLGRKQPFAIQLFHNAKCMRFSKLLGGVCQSQIVGQSHDLTKLYDEISYQPRDGSFVPDLLLTKRGDPSRRLYIEIAVTHMASVQKRESGNRIIEILIGSEKDLEKIRRRELSQEDEDVRFINFKPQPVSLSDSECICASEKWHLFRVFRAGNCHMIQLPPTEIEAVLLKERQDIIWQGVKPFEELGGTAYVDFVLEANLARAPIRSCFICKYSGRNFRWEPKAPVFCKYWKKSCRSTEAVQCNIFRRKPLEGQSI